MSSTPRSAFRRSSPAIFVVVEGLDGAGRSSVARATAAAIGAVHLRLPTPPERDDGCREADQLARLGEVFGASTRVSEHLARGVSVVLERYFLWVETEARLLRAALTLDHLAAHLEPADLTVFLDAPLDVRKKRLAALNGKGRRHGARLHPSADARLRELHVARRDLPVVGRFVYVDASARSPDELAAHVVEELRAVVL